MIYEFGDFLLDTRRHELRRGDTPLHLEPQVHAVLCHLVENGDRLVSSRELIERVWGSRFITPGTLNSRIKALRHALGDDGTTQCVVQTIRGRGFRMGIPVKGRADAPRPDAPGATAALRRAAQRPAAQRPAHAEQQIHFCHAHDGVRIAYATYGDPSAPALVKPANWLTHVERDCDSAVWRHWVSELGRDYRFIRYDERGCGLSDHDAADLSFESWVRDLEAVVDAERLERFSLLGISQGCAVAIAYTLRHPERVEKLVLYGGYAAGRRYRTHSPQEELEATLMHSLIRVGWGKDNPAFRQVFGTLFVPDGTPEQWQWFCDLARTVPVENALRITELTYDIDVRELCARVDKPALVLHAVGDAMIPFENGRRLAALIRGARFVPLDSRNHVLLEHEPAWARFLEEVRTFLGGGGADVATR